MPDRLFRDQHDAPHIKQRNANTAQVIINAPVLQQAETWVPVMANQLHRTVGDQWKPNEA